MDFEEKYGFVPSSDLETQGFEYTIPEGFEAEIKDGKVIVRKKESDDERIRKFLVKHVSELIGCIEHDLKISSKDIESEEELAMFKAGLAYLEKQKENPKTVDSIPSFCVSDVKWADTIITRAIVALSDDVDYNMDEPCKYKREIDDLKKLRDVLCGKKKQKPADKLTLENPLTGEKVYEREIPECMMGGDPKDAEAIIHLAAKGWTVIAPGKEQKPAEWSEEDDEHINSILKRLEGMCKKGATFTQTRFAVSEDKDWLKSLRPQPKIEWSKEEMGILLESISALQNSSHWLLADKLSSLRPQPHWRPSKEQICALERCVDYLDESDNEDAGMISSLCNDLKKLM